MLNDPLLHSMAVELHESTLQLSSVDKELSYLSHKVPHIHFTRLEIGGFLAGGGNATVFHADLDGERLAVKRQYWTELEGYEQLQSLTKEIAMSWLLTNSCNLIVKCRGFTFTPPYTYVAMDLYEHGDLRTVLQDKGLPYCDRLQLAHDAASAVAHLHKLEVAVLKPGSFGWTQASIADIPS